MSTVPLRFSDDNEPTATGAAPAADAEAYTVYRPDTGAPVDAPDTSPTLTWADVTSGDTARRMPILPAWMMSTTTRRATLRALGDSLAYYAAFHTVRSPKYLGKALLYAPIGAARLVGKALWWASAEEGNFNLRQHAANTNDAYTRQSLNRTRSKESKPRWLLVGAAAAAACAGGSALAVSDVLPPIGWYAAAAGAVLFAARAGRPADKPITDRVSTSLRFTRLTAEMVRQALVSLRLAGLTEGGQVEFVHPGIHRDGPGWLARVNLPAGVEAVQVLDRRGKLSSALRLPVDQVWPAGGPEHSGQLDLWVGYQPASKMGTPRWSITADNATTSVFREEEFGSDERQRPVKTSGFARSFLIGGQPGSGKSYGGRALAQMFALDPTVEFKIAEFKGTGDFLDFEPLCSTYVVGVDDNALDQGAGIIRWAIGEAERRGKRILAARQRGDAPEGKVTPELARKAGSGLHPIVLLFDEVHELFAHDKTAADDCERLIKRARALGIIVILCTQIPDKGSLPPNITRCVTNRWCMSVAGQVENDMILGTGAYKRGLTGTVYRPVVDAGWGVMTGGPVPVSVRSQYPTAEQSAAILGRALALRGGKRASSGEQPPARDLLSDLLDVAASNGQHWQPAAAALVDRWPNAYPNLTGDALSEIARALGVASADVKISGKVLKGFRTVDVRDLIATRTAAN
ncbi:cell division protein FtsK [Catellatospora sp. TT07R-123]|uniref:cell division protein FtsK n=1 Tax=Catellatospora sp. TT07R-123 TaxID=2733863 RepID=UPI001B21E252|nr:cell division protein FtsK [Catellatospora sp. TT07R-123]GHJ43301.1 cell division protein FtsK [Catellatospora sp. TT07R-123]